MASFVRPAGIGGVWWCEGGGVEGVAGRGGEWNSPEVSSGPRKSSSVNLSRREDLPTLEAPAGRGSRVSAPASRRSLPRCAAWKR